MCLSGVTVFLFTPFQYNLFSYFIFPHRSFTFIHFHCMAFPGIKF
ncbi:hypothetical protein E2C01_049250 [Portunus trituberculatus]|uniref:Uncharacterized protein n=1 Tax=Portunus trituberculatus TaxID=210409 RepID=A0A5B7GDQ8_PORTR|nr:hypothetical protein [Portunus trituberculatus]